MARGRAIPHQAHDAPRYVARVPFDYGEQSLDRGQVTTLIGAVNDERLTRLGYFATLEPGTTLYQCAHCGASFVGVRERTEHGNRRHAPARPRTPEEEDAAAEREDRMLEQIAPLFLDKTQATGGY